MDEPTQEQIGRLPKWAQQYISRLERDRTSALAETAGIREDQEGSRLTLRARGYISEPRGLDEHAVFEAAFGYDKISVKLREDHLEVMATGAGQLTISPRSGNVVRLAVVRQP